MDGRVEGGTPIVGSGAGPGAGPGAGLRAGVSGWAGALLGLVVPVVCGGCGEPDIGLCAVCRARLGSAPPHEVSPHAWSRRGLSGRVPVFSAASYEGPVRELLVAWKDGGRLDLTEPLADVLASVVGACLRTLGGNPERRPSGEDRRLLLVPVPSSRAAVRRRGEDVMYELARRAAGSQGLSEGVPTHVGARFGIAARPGPPGVPTGPGTWGRVRAARLLAQRRGVRDQAGLSTAERLTNLQGRLRRRRSWDDWPRAAGGPRGVDGAPRIGVVLVDDIVTTGASLAAAALALSASGLPVLGAATVAWTPRRRVGTSGPHSPVLRTVGYRRAGLAWRARPDERGEAPRA